MNHLTKIATLALAAAAAVGCGKSDTTHPVTTSNVSGTLSLGSFPTAPMQLVARNEAGAATTIAVGADGRFEAVLGKDHSYRLAVVSTNGEVPVVFPRTNGKLDTNFSVGSGNAKFEMGTVRYLTTAPTTGFKMAGGEVGECVDGHTQGSGEQCADDDDKVSCVEGPEGDGDGECQNGKDVKTGAACTDADEPDVEAADDQPMAVPDHNPPQSVDGCKDDGDGEETDD